MLLPLPRGRWLRLLPLLCYAPYMEHRVAGVGTTSAAQHTALPCACAHCHSKDRASSCHDSGDAPENALHGSGGSFPVTSVNVLVDSASRQPPKLQMTNDRL